MCRVPEECPQEIADLVQQCKAVDPRQRPSARQAFDIIKANFAKKRLHIFSSACTAVKFIRDLSLQAFNLCVTLPECATSLPTRSTKHLGQERAVPQPDSSHMCRPLPASRLLSQSTSLDSATLSQKTGRPDGGELQASEAEQAAVIAPHPMQSPFESVPSGLPGMQSPPDTPLSGLPKRHEGPAVTDHGHIGPTTSLVPPDASISASNDLIFTFDSRSGSSTSQASYQCSGRFMLFLHECVLLQVSWQPCFFLFFWTLFQTHVANALTS